MTTAVRAHCRWMIRADLPEVLAIESASFPEWPWGEEDFLRRLRQRNCIGRVIENEYAVIGFMLYELHRDRLHVVHFSIDPKERNQGLGSMLHDGLLGKLNSHSRKRATVDLSEHALEFQLWLKKRGWLATKIDGDEIRMEYLR